ncbi:ganglioside-induced differentiation-associated protein 1-like isoform X1 [Mercenaria mercenaria]|uniref:ganglioside-induced differentiation-associated protein 1-like isoform X1 n=1 Tax=Mercenaria mercenaria TaxID=6596 RepID=UPI00234ECC65|nr:ganglioside-induced differentiation-associated protein 1-like isoform X1 [Mercenaria mercenaria]
MNIIRNRPKHSVHLSQGCLENKMAADTGKSVTLYYFPGSYYSLKVLHALYEKDVSFKEKHIFIVLGEQNEEWYLKKNNMGEVPCLEIDGKCTSESEAIIDVIDQTFHSGGKLVPDVKTAVGNEVKTFRKFLHDIPIDVITYGVFANREFCVDRSYLDKLPAKVTARAEISKRFSGEVTHLIKVSEALSPEMKETINAKIVKVSRKLANVLNKEEVAKCLNELEDVFNKIAELLEKNTREHGDANDTWLFGPAFTAADITAIGLMIRLTFIGIAPRYFSIDKRPIVQAYYTRAMQRPSVKKILEVMDAAPGAIMRSFIKSKALKVLKFAIAVGVVALGYVGFKKTQTVNLLPDEKA